MNLNMLSFIAMLATSQAKMPELTDEQMAKARALVTPGENHFLLLAVLEYESGGAVLTAIPSRVILALRFFGS